MRIEGTTLSGDVEVLRVEDSDGNPVTVTAAGGKAKVTLPASGGSLLAFTITAADVIDPANGTVAASGGLIGGGEATIGTFTAAVPGVSGNAIYVSSPTPPPNTAATTVALDGTGVIVTIETDSEGLELGTLQDVQDAIEATPAVAAVVSFAIADQQEDNPYPFEAVVELINGESLLSCAVLASGSIIQDATPFFPQAFDSGVVMRPVFLTDDGDVALFDDGDPDSSSGDSDGGSAAVWYLTGQPTYNPTHRFRVSDAVPVAVRASGLPPSEGEMLLVIDVRTPA